MEPVVERPEEAELHLLTDWSDPDARKRHRIAAIGAVATNIALIVGVTLLPDAAFRPYEAPTPLEQVTPLVLPFELTQKDPNHGKISKEFELQAQATPRHAILGPASPPPGKRGDQPRPAPALPPSPMVQPAVPQSLPEPPKVEAAQQQPQELPRGVQSGAPAPPPQIQATEKPRLTFENVPAPAGPLPPEQRRIALPSASITDAAREAMRGTPLGTVVGDSGASGSGYSGMSQSATPGNPLANIELRSDPDGVDFRPYLTQLIARIKQNWLAVIPQSAQMGVRGKVTLLLRIAKNGNLEKVVYAEQSGALALDRAAVAGVSASAPLPPLPKDFRGDRIDLRLNFAYR